MPDNPDTAAAAVGAADTHVVANVGTPLVDYNLFRSDPALMEAVVREGAQWASDRLEAFGAHIGTADYLELGDLANRYRPELETHDRFGHRVDRVRFHAAYHRLMRMSLEHGLHATPWRQPGAGAHVARAAHNLLHTQVEAGHGCPITMTFACIPTLRLQRELAARFEPAILALDYDPRDVPAADKRALTVGMGMTEKQGGSDVRANTTRATPVGPAGPGQRYRLVGHKWFLSAPMCDLFLVLAQAAGGLSCFLVPRWCDDGNRNPLQIIRLKNKLGNRSNASSEVELRAAEGWLIGEEGRGVANILEMVSLTRFDCMVGSAAGQRMAIVQALHHCRSRRAFGRLLVEQPLMANVLADMALEYEGALALSMRLARALDRRDHDPQEAALSRIGNAIGKYWICKRGPQLCYEAMECLGGNGVMEDCIMPRLYREAVINPIWEGSGNIQCLDILRALQREPATRAALCTELERARGGNALLDVYLDALYAELDDPAELEYRARSLAGSMALALQSALLVQHAPDSVSEAYCAARLQGSGHHFGQLPRGVATRAILARSFPI